MKQPELGKHIAALRAANNLTQADLANKCQVNVRTIQRIENGDVMPRHYTINLLNSALQTQLSLVVEKENMRSGEKLPSRTMNLAVIAGMIYTLNAIPVVYDLINHVLVPVAHRLTTIVHIASCISFFRGFYQIGQHYKNRSLATGALMMMLLLPAVNLFYLFYIIVGQAIAFVLMSIGVLLIGVGLIKQAPLHKGKPGARIYKLAGIVSTLISLAYLSLDARVIYTALIVSLPCNLLMVYLLYGERSQRPDTAEYNNAALSAA